MRHSHVARSLGNDATARASGGKLRALGIGMVAAPAAASSGKRRALRVGDRGKFVGPTSAAAASGGKRSGDTGMVGARVAAAAAGGAAAARGPRGKAPAGAIT